MFLQIEAMNLANGIFALAPGSCPRGETWGARGHRRSKKFKHGHVTRSIKEALQKVLKISQVILEPCERGNLK